MNIQEFFAMGGYAAYVWPAYAVTLALLIVNIVMARSSHRRAVQEAKRRLQSMAERR